MRGSYTKSEGNNITNKDKRMKLKLPGELAYFTLKSIFYTSKSQMIELKVNVQSFFIGWGKLFRKNASRSK